MWKNITTVILGALFVLLFVFFVLGLVITRDLLSPQLYTQALAENDIYERVYTDLLADPAVQESFKETTGIQIDLLGEELYAQVVSALFLILPPQRMEAAATTFFTDLTAYFKGDTPELPEEVNFGAAATPEALAESVVKAATAATFALINAGQPIIVDKTEQLVEEELVAYLDNFDEGRLVPIPDHLLRASVSDLTTAENEQLVSLMLGPASETAGPQTRLQMEAALAEDDLTSAVATAVTERLELVTGPELTGAEEELAQSKALVGLSGAAVAIGQTRDELVAGLNTVRDNVGWLQNALLPLAIILAALLSLYVWRSSDDLRSALRAAGWTLTVASGLVLLLWLIGGLILRAQVKTELAEAALGPASLQAMVDDSVASLFGGIWDSIWATTLTFLIFGLILLAFGHIGRLLAYAEKLFSGAWANRKWVVGGLVLIFVLLPLLFGLFRGDARSDHQPCNGHPELCDRPVNEVAYAASHNSMSIAEYGWIWPMHDGTLTDQLDAGVRALLIDTHYIDREEAREEFLASLPEKSREVVAKAFEANGEMEQEVTFLCHKFCGMGWSVLERSLEEVRLWLEENPREVLFLVIEDKITPADTEVTVLAAALEQFIYDYPEGEPWPTLRQLIDSNERLIVMAENEGPPPDWYTNAWDVTEETPYTFITTDMFSCEPNRGETGKPFFLLNHWIQRGSPNRVDGATVNAYDFLLKRAEQCAEERGKLPNFIAVNWYRQGDLFAVVDALNGVGGTDN